MRCPLLSVQLEEARLQAEDDGCCSVDCVIELRSLRHLDRVIDSDASSIVVVAFYSRVGANICLPACACALCMLCFGWKHGVPSCLSSRARHAVPYLAVPVCLQSCGTCKDMLVHYKELCQEVCCRKSSMLVQAWAFLSTASVHACGVFACA